MKRNGITEFFDKVEPRESSCWLWRGTVTIYGYGQFSVGDISHRAHRWIYEQMVEPIPVGLTLDHLCKTLLCVNPDHLEVVTRGENSRRAHPRKESCLNGHLLEGQNVYQRRHRRSCKECQRQRWREYYWRRLAPERRNEVGDSAT